MHQKNISWLAWEKHRYWKFPLDLSMDHFFPNRRELLLARALTWCWTHSRNPSEWHLSNLCITTASTTSSIVGGSSFIKSIFFSLWSEGGRKRFSLGWQQGTPYPPSSTLTTLPLQHFIAIWQHTSVTLPKSSADNPPIPSGSHLWASNPAERIINSGEKLRTAGETWLTSAFPMAWAVTFWPSGIFNTPGWGDVSPLLPGKIPSGCFAPTPAPRPKSFPYSSVTSSSYPLTCAPPACRDMYRNLESCVEHKISCVPFPILIFLTIN